MAQLKCMTGRRKCSVARVRLSPGTGIIKVNDKDVLEYFGRRTLELVVNAPFAVTNTVGKYDVDVDVQGGGVSGQAGAVRHGIARARAEADPDLRSVLKRAGFLTRDPRMKERRCGLRGPQGTSVLKG